MNYFSLSIINIDNNEFHTAHFTHSYFVCELFVESTTFSSPLFLFSDNAATMTEHLMDVLILIPKFTDPAVLSTGYQHALIIASKEG